MSAIEVEALKQVPGKVHVFPRETRRGKAQWGIWIDHDGSAVLFVGDDQVILPANSLTRDKYIRSDVDGQIVYQKV